MEEPNHTTARNPGPLKSFNILCTRPLKACINTVYERPNVKNKRKREQKWDAKSYSMCMRNGFLTYGYKFMHFL
jgi:hypothetical protein